MGTRQRATAGAGGTAAHRDDARHGQRHRQLDGRPQTGLRIAALGGIGMQKIAGGVDRPEPQSVFAQLAGQPVALRACPERSEVEMRARPRAPGADAELDVQDATLGAPGKQPATIELRKRVRVDADSHAAALRKADVSSSMSRRACSTVVSTDAWPVAAAWNARSS